MKSNRPYSGITLLQLLLPLALLFVGFSLFPPALARARQTAGQARCRDNLKQIMLATANAADTNKGLLPPLAGDYPNEEDFSGFGTIFFHVLRYIEQDQFHKQAFEKIGGKSKYTVWMNSTYAKRIATYECPDDTTNPKNELFQGWLAPGSYAANFLVFGLLDEVGNPVSLQGKSRIPASIPDGTSNTIAFAERYQICNGDPNAWGYYGDHSWSPRFAYGTKALPQFTPAMTDCEVTVPQSMHATGVHVALADGSAHLVTRKVGSTTWWYACNPNDGQVLGADW
jgi:hypothetical protein